MSKITLKEFWSTTFSALWISLSSAIASIVLWYDSRFEGSFPPFYTVGSTVPAQRFSSDILSTLIITSNSFISAFLSSESSRYVILLRTIATLRSYGHSIGHLRSSCFFKVLQSCFLGASKKHRSCFDKQSASWFTQLLSSAEKDVRWRWFTKVQSSVKCFERRY